MVKGDKLVQVCSKPPSKVALVYPGEPEGSISVTVTDIVNRLIGDSSPTGCMTFFLCTSSLWMFLGFLGRHIFV